MKSCSYSTQGHIVCKRSDENATTSPQGNVVEHYTVATCNKPDNWCTHKGAVLKKVDCRGDGKAEDYVCWDFNGQKGLITRDSGCQTIWPNADFSTCSKASNEFLNMQKCDRPSTTWCSHQKAVLRTADCIGNGFGGDLVCTDPYNNAGLISRKKQCKPEWPRADISSCKFS